MLTDALTAGDIALIAALRLFYTSALGLFKLLFIGIAFFFGFPGFSLAAFYPFLFLWSGSSGRLLTLRPGLVARIYLRHTLSGYQHTK